MHPAVFARKSADAQDRIKKAAKALATGRSLPSDLLKGLEATARGNDQAVTGLMRQEAVADLLEALASSAEKPTASEQPAGAKPQDAGAGGGEPPAPAVPPKQHAAVRERAKARGGKA